MKKGSLFLLLSALLILAFLLRFTHLSKRPMHTDEAVHAYKMGTLIETQSYIYDKNEYHGPTLNYLTLIPVTFTGINSYQELNEYILRSVPAFFGFLTVLLPVLLIKHIGLKKSLIITLLLAISHISVFYSRYYIQETVLTFFILCLIISVYLYLKKPKTIYAVTAGLSAGLCSTTKETWIINVTALIISLAICFIVSRKKSHINKRKFKPQHIIFFLTSFVIINIIFFSSFFNNPTGIIEAFKTYNVYINRAVNNQYHTHPWYTYIRWFGFFRINNQIPWSESVILILGLTGLYKAFQQNNMFFKIIALYTLMIFIIYSAIPYKTPWNMLAITHGLIFLSPLGIKIFLDLAGKKTSKIAITAVLSILIIHLGIQTYLGNFIYYASPSNPYVYAHTSKDLPQNTQKICTKYKDPSTPITVIFEKSDYWPLPWYLRHYKQVSWLTEPEKIKNLPAVLIFESKLIEPVSQKIYKLQKPGQMVLYKHMFSETKQLRPGKYFSVFIKED